MAGRQSGQTRSTSMNTTTPFKTDVADPSSHHLFCLYMSIIRATSAALSLALPLPLSLPPFPLYAEASTRQRGPPSAGGSCASRANVEGDNLPPFHTGLPPDSNVWPVAKSTKYCQNTSRRRSLLPRRDVSEIKEPITLQPCDSRSPQDQPLQPPHTLNPNPKQDPGPPEISQSCHAAGC